MVASVNRSRIASNRAAVISSRLVSSLAARARPACALPAATVLPALAVNTREADHCLCWLCSSLKQKLHLFKALLERQRRSNGGRKPFVQVRPPMAKHDVGQLASEALSRLHAGVRDVGVELSSWECRKYANNLRDKTMVITGGGSGIGRDLAKFAGSKGARVAIGDVNLKGAEAAAADIRAAGGQAFAYKCNVTSWESQLEFFKKTYSEYGDIDIVVPAAGIGEKIGPGFEDDILDDKGDLAKPITATMDIDFVGVVYSTKLAYYYLRKNPTRKGKALVFVGSIVGFVAFPLAPLYSASKHGLLGLMRSAHYQLSASGIRCSQVSPWFVETGIIDPLYRAGLIGLPFSKISDVTSALVAAVSHPDVDGASLVVDSLGVWQIGFTDPSIGSYNYYNVFTARAALIIDVFAYARDAAKTVKVYAQAYSKLAASLAFLMLLFGRHRLQALLAAVLNRSRRFQIKSS